MNQTRIIRLPIHVVKELNVYLRTARELAQTLDHEPTAEEIAKTADKPVAKVERMLKLNERVTSLDAPVGDNSGKAMLDAIPDEESSDPETLLQNNNISGNLENWLDMLPEKHAEVLSRRFGLRGFDMSTLEEVGKEIGLTRERIRQLQVEALRRLRVIVESHGLSSEDLLK